LNQNNRHIIALLKSDKTPLSKLILQAIKEQQPTLIYKNTSLNTMKTAELIPLLDSFDLIAIPKDAYQPQPDNDIPH